LSRQWRRPASLRTQGQNGCVSTGASRRPTSKPASGYSGSARLRTAAAVFGPSRSLVRDWKRAPRELGRLQRLCSCMKVVFIAALAMAASPALAQPVPNESQARFRDLASCVERSIGEYDDRISSAEVVAGALVKVCRATTPAQGNPEPAGVVEALVDAALVSVLKSRVQAAVPATRAGARQPGVSSSNRRDDEASERPRRSRAVSRADRERGSARTRQHRR